MNAGNTGGLNCPFCGQHYSLTAEQVPQYAGQVIACTVCKRQFTVPLQLNPSVGQQGAPAQPVAQYPQQGFAPPVGFAAEGAVPTAQYAGAGGWQQSGYAAPMVSPPSSGLRAPDSTGFGPVGPLLMPLMLLIIGDGDGDAAAIDIPPMPERRAART